MGTAPVSVTREAGRNRLAARDREHRFFTGMGLVALLVALIGFAPSYYLRSFSAAEPLTTLVHLHGGLATAWLLLFIAQTSLVSAGRTDLHRRPRWSGARGARTRRRPCHLHHGGTKRCLPARWSAAGDTPAPSAFLRPCGGGHPRPTPEFALRGMDSVLGRADGQVIDRMGAVTLNAMKGATSTWPPSLLSP